MLADALAIIFQYDIDYQQMWHLVHIDGQLSETEKAKATRRANSGKINSGMTINAISKNQAFR